MDVDLVRGIKDTAIGYFLYFAFTIFNVLVLYNLLIAVISDVYPKKKEFSDRVWRASIFKEMERSLPRSEHAKRSHSRSGSTMQRIRAWIRMPERMLLRLFERMFHQHPHNWQYGAYTDQSLFGTNTDSEGED